ncbi:sensor histidine kinase [Cellulomonas sp. URHD0024]|uniref:sensor histidine kinase n=1 Tax=Cellulomonas sp. URHD0024 TaxID=1302620 RepID=UPI0006887BD2|nr:sensor histidine kinase [Cellulomonas sp. URHD0024]
MTEPVPGGAWGAGPPWAGRHWSGGRPRSAWLVVPVAALATVTLLGCVFASLWKTYERSFDVGAALLLVLAPASILLVVRRGAWAVVGGVLAVLGPVAYLALGYPRGPAVVPLGFVIVAAGATRQRALSLGVGLAGVLGVVAVAVATGEPSAVYAAFTVVGLAVAMVLGEGARGRRERMRALTVARESREEAAVAAERLRIARELHDVLAHSLSAITVQAGVGLHLMDREPEQARKALGAIRDTSRDALDEVREVLGVLRAQGEAPREPAAVRDLDGLLDLVRMARDDGLTVDDDGLAEAVDAVRGVVPEAAGVAVHRALQEALTNVRRHSPATSVQVRLLVEGGSLGLSVRDDGEVQEPVLEGYGLRGMRERVEGLGGSLVVEHTDGFRVSVEIPWAAAR